jgi:hypothetical protein
LERLNWSFFDCYMSTTTHCTGFRNLLSTPSAPALDAWGEIGNLKRDDICDRPIHNTAEGGLPNNNNNNNNNT